jgi:hypothetical protein
MICMLVLMGMSESRRPKDIFQLQESCFQSEHMSQHRNLPYENNGIHRILTSGLAVELDIVME